MLKISNNNINKHISTVNPTRCINVSNLFYWSNTLHVSDGLSLRHQELKTVHTARDICQTACSRQYLFDICLLHYVQSLTPDDGRTDCPKHVECYSNKISLRQQATGICQTDTDI